MDMKKSLGMALDSIRSPTKNTKPMNVEQSVRFYYGVAIPVFVVAVIVNLILYFTIGTFRTVGGPAASLVGSNAGLGAASAIGLPALMLFVITPISIVISAAIYQLFSKLLFDLVKKDFSRTLNAFVHGIMPSLLLFWLVSIPYFGIAVQIIAGVWSLVVLMISLAKQQGINYKQAIGTYLLSVFTLGAIIFVIIGGLAAATIGTLLHTGYLTGSHMMPGALGWNGSGSSVLGCSFPVSPASSPQCVISAFRSSGYSQLLNYTTAQAAYSNPISWLGNNAYLCQQYPQYFTNC